MKNNNKAMVRLLILFIFTFFSFVRVNSQTRIPYSKIERVEKDGIFHFATDDDHYYESVCKVISASNLFAENSAMYSDIADIKSDFERRWLAQGKQVRHLTWAKAP